MSRTCRPPSPIRNSSHKSDSHSQREKLLTPAAKDNSAKDPFIPVTCCVSVVTSHLTGFCADECSWCVDPQSVMTPPNFTLKECFTHKKEESQQTGWDDRPIVLTKTWSKKRFKGFKKASFSKYSIIFKELCSKGVFRSVPRDLNI